MTIRSHGELRVALDRAIRFCRMEQELVGAMMPPGLTSYRSRLRALVEFETAMHKQGQQPMEQYHEDKI